MFFLILLPDNGAQPSGAIDDRQQLHIAINLIRASSA